MSSGNETTPVLPADGAFITAQLADNEVVNSVVLTKARNPLSRGDVESHFEGELSKSSAADFGARCVESHLPQLPRDGP